ncbi:MAG: hypothetical protein QOJ99_4761 [Bryobacterales bacterium]|nr:hypothetical protein [Bryobacterales bacterium]
MLHDCPYFLQILQESRVLESALLRIRRTEDGRGMDGGGGIHRPRMLDEVSALPGQAVSGPEHCLCRCGPQTDDDLRTYQLYLSFKPGTTGPYLRCVRLLVNSALSALFKLEVLYGVGDVNGGAINAGILESAIQ